jgi:hypothetical protein
MEPQKPPIADEQSTTPPARKPYEAPRLQVYGDLTEITRGKNSGALNDGSGHPNMHFTS